MKIKEARYPVAGEDRFLDQRPLDVCEQPPLIRALVI